MIASGGVVQPRIAGGGCLLGPVGAATLFISTSTTGDPVHAIGDLQGREPFATVLSKGSYQPGDKMLLWLSRIVHNEIFSAVASKDYKQEGEEGGRRKGKGTVASTGL